ncbi:Diguanylate cyclase DosC [Thalassocella blandensis]|nr:Diguanylate cyclase DosC [Thalassocella blandensis]
MQVISISVGRVTTHLFLFVQSIFKQMQTSAIVFFRHVEVYRATSVLRNTKGIDGASTGKETEQALVCTSLDSFQELNSSKISDKQYMASTATSPSASEGGSENNQAGKVLNSGNNSGRSNSSEDVINVLIVEDDIDDFYLVRQILGRDSARKYDIVHCDSLQQSLDMLQRTKVDIILLDLGLGDSSGLETLQHMANAIMFSTPIVVLTGTNDVELGERAIKVGAEDYVPKEEANTSLLSRSIRYSIERHFLLQQFQQRATTDPLTLLPNRSALMERIENLMLDVSRNHAKMAIAMMDLDGFKEINDSFGHQAGDEVLKEIAERMKMRLRCSDMAARLGGDEFVLLLTNYHNHNELLDVLQRKQKRLSQSMNLTVQDATHEVSVGISIGVAEWKQGLSAHQLLAIADEAMYDSKRKGKNMITLSEE